MPKELGSSGGIKRCSGKNMFSSCLQQLLNFSMQNRIGGKKPFLKILSSLSVRLNCEKAHNMIPVPPSKASNLLIPKQGKARLGILDISKTKGDIV